MKNSKEFLSYLRLQFSILFCFRPKVFILGHPTHTNLGDQAQLMCTEKWLHENYPKHSVFHLGVFTKTLYDYNPVMAVYRALLFLFSYVILKLKVRRNDIFIGHSGYFMIDHHNGWKMFVDIIRFFPQNKIVIFPQTINFYTPYIRKYISGRFTESDNITLMCRDETSYSNAKQLFPKTKLLLFPDIVTSLIGIKQYTGIRNGVLFCLRNDLEAHYLENEILSLISKFRDARVERTDTTLAISESYMKKNRNRLIWEMIERFSKFQLVVTDRYHGTIFAAVAATPVVVINSADHKLSSGVKWFPEEFQEYVSFADDLEEAFEKAKGVLENSEYEYKLPAYFFNTYYKGLKNLL
jgi:exopolysaccharide biosynthesis predicted pyruvyltransferase EpsI